MSRFDPASYGPTLSALLGERTLNPLDAGTPRTVWRERLSALDDHALFNGRPVRDRVMASACRAGLWLAFDFLDEAHALSQELHTTEGSYWHALMHRREPDFANAAYWLRRVGSHAIHDNLARVAAEIGYLKSGSRWDPFSFNNDCQAQLGKEDATEELLRRVQQAEWELLFAWCHRQATGD